MRTQHHHAARGAATMRHDLRQAAIVLAACILPAHSAWALVKCIDGEGKVTFQDVMCSNQSSSVALLQRFGQVTTEAAPPGRAKPQRTGETPPLPERQVTAKAR